MHSLSAAIGKRDNPTLIQYTKEALGYKSSFDDFKKMS